MDHEACEEKVCKRWIFKSAKIELKSSCSWKRKDDWKSAKLQNTKIAE